MLPLLPTGFGFFDASEEGTYEDLMRKKALADVIAKRRGRAKNVGEGVGDMMSGLAAGILRHRAGKGLANVNKQNQAAIDEYNKSVQSPNIDAPNATTSTQASVPSTAELATAQMLYGDNEVEDAAEAMMADGSSVRFGGSSNALASAIKRGRDAKANTRGIQLTPEEKTVMAMTVGGEARGEDLLGQQKVAESILNRVRDPRWPDNPIAVAKQRAQYSTWNDTTGGAGGAGASYRPGPGTPEFDKAMQAVEMALGADDPTGGATHYYSPKGMELLRQQGKAKRSIPSWWNAEKARAGGNVIKHGGHLFTGLAEGEQKYGGGPRQIPTPQISPRFAGYVPRAPGEVAALQSDGSEWAGLDEAMNEAGIPIQPSVPPTDPMVAQGPDPRPNVRTDTGTDPKGPAVVGLDERIQRATLPELLEIVRNRDSLNLTRSQIDAIHQRAKALDPNISIPGDPQPAPEQVPVTPDKAPTGNPAPATNPAQSAIAQAYAQRPELRNSPQFTDAAQDMQAGRDAGMMYDIAGVPQPASARQGQTGMFPARPGSGLTGAFPPQPGPAGAALVNPDATVPATQDRWAGLRTTSARDPNTLGTEAQPHPTEPSPYDRRDQQAGYEERVDPNQTASVDPNVPNVRRVQVPEGTSVEDAIANQSPPTAEELGNPAQRAPANQVAGNAEFAQKLQAAAVRREQLRAAIAKGNTLLARPGMSPSQQAQIQSQLQALQAEWESLDPGNMMRNEKLRRELEQGETPLFRELSIPDGKGGTIDVLVQYDPASNSWFPAKVPQGGTTGHGVNINDSKYGQGEKKGAEAASKADDEYYQQVLADEQSAWDMKENIAVMEELMNTPGFRSGAGADWQIAAGQIASLFGFEWDGTGTMQAFQARANKAALDAMGGSLGAGFSDADRKFVVSQVAQITNEAEANRVILEIQRRIAQRRIQIGEMADAFVNRPENGGLMNRRKFSVELREWRKQQPSMFEGLADEIEAGKYKDNYDPNAAGGSDPVPPGIGVTQEIWDAMPQEDRDLFRSE